MNSPTPPYEQVRREVVEQVRSGELRPGDKLPAIRVHAADLGLSAGTVARAYKLLEEAQVIVTKRGAGTTIAPDAVAASERSAATTQREHGGTADPAVVALLAGPVAEARGQGHSDLAIMASLRAALAGQNGAASAASGASPA
ncbi:GntR family transcriptional regulator [Brachybacterium sp. P6-10-X1]|uniref:GntR family transcriptional regulator n=1 Tax=Brachybacterium sp. P6-10-X1 TaxID=1903186 RepID=UPI0009717AB1|nr:GntR family transcriptional regulator [Brachybacterium sp. P6-10-X1]APX34162.1 GntR family transcriptional regulator [Brachybacterium sp. P6-10-X1]